MDFRQTVEAFAAGLGIAAATPDGDGSITFLFDGEHEVTFSPAERGDILFQCEIGDAGLLGGDGCRALLEASFSDTGGAAFAIHRALGKVVLWIRHGEFESLSAFRKSVDDFLSQVVAWKKRFSDGGFGVPSDEDAPNAADDTESLSTGFSAEFLQV